MLLGTNKIKYQYHEAQNICDLTHQKFKKLCEEKLFKGSTEYPKHLYSYTNQWTKRRGNVLAL